MCGFGRWSFDLKGSVGGLTGGWEFDLTINSHESELGNVKSILLMCAMCPMPIDEERSADRLFFLSSFHEFPRKERLHSNGI